jgi:hypothetical protein
VLLYIRRHGGAITFALSLLFILLSLANAWKYRLISVDWLRTQKDALLAFNSILTTAIIITGALFSYYRFFRGRTLSLRSELSLDISVHATPEGYKFHAGILTAKNVGGSTIWNPKPIITLHIHGSETVAERRDIDEWWSEHTNSSNMAPVIDPGESVTFFTSQHIPDEAWAVTYIASMAADQGDIWYVSKTVSNKEE